MRQPRANTSAIALFALLLSCCFAWPAVAGAESGGVLAPELAELASPTVRSQPLEAQAEALGFPTSGPGSLQRDGSQVAVELEFEGGAVAALPALREAGATITAASGIYQRVDAVRQPRRPPRPRRASRRHRVEPVRTPIVYAPETSVSQTAICEGGTVLSEGIDQLGIVTSRATSGYAKRSAPAARARRSASSPTPTTSRPRSRAAKRRSRPTPPKTSRATT